MPLSLGPVGQPVLLARVEFGQPVYRRGDVITFRVLVEGVTPTVQPVEFAGSVMLPGGVVLPVTATVDVVDGPVFGPFTADGYTVTQDQHDPSQYTATPDHGGPS